MIATSMQRDPSRTARAHARVAALRQSSAPSLAIKIYTYAGLLLVSGALQRPIGGDGLRGAVWTGVIRETNTRIQIVAAAFYAVTALLLLLGLRRVRVPPGTWPLIVLAILAPVSAIWSDNWVATLTRSTGLIGCTLFAVVAASRLGRDGVSDVLVKFSAAFILANLALSVAAPSYAFHSGSEIFGVHAGSLKGTFSHKNSLARVLAFAVIVVALLPASGSRAKWFYWVCAFVGTVLLIQTNSAKTFISVPLAITGAIAIARLASAGRRVAALGALLFAGLVLVTSGAADALSSSFLGIVGRDPTLSARTMIWEAALRKALDNPILGGGYEAAWPGEIGAAVRATVGFDPGHAHNGYLQTFVDLGAVGLSLILIFLVRSSAAAIRAKTALPNPTYLFTCAWLLMYAVNNLAGSYMIQTSDIYWFMLVLTPYMIRWSTFRGPVVE